MADSASSRSCHAPICLLRPPSASASAALRCDSVSASMRSASPSASVRSMRPLSNARRVNSPGRASRNPSTTVSAPSNASTTALPPWHCSSTTSSPVELAGESKRSTSASSSNARVRGWRSSRTAAVLASGSDPAMRPAASCAAGPLMRITEVAAGGRPLDKAKTVSPGTRRRLAHPAERSNYRVDQGPAEHRRNVVIALPDHLQRDPQDDQQADPGDPAVTLDVTGDEVRGDAHQGDRDHEPDDEDPGMLARRSGDREHVVEAHADVGDGDAPGGGGEALGGLQPRTLVADDLVRPRRTIGRLTQLAPHFPCHPQQEQPAGKDQADDLQELGDDQCESDSQD